MSDSQRVIIIGGGMIGLLTAHELRTRGHDVLVLDAGTGRGSASSGNVGLIAPGHPPIANPNLLPRSLELLLDPDSPLYIPPRFNLSLVRWLLGFRRACQPRHHAHVVEVLNRMSLISRAEWQELMNIPALSDTLDPVGFIEVFCEEESGDIATRDLEVLRRDGFDAELIDGDELRRRDPAYTEQVIGALVHAQDIVTHPDRLLIALEHHLVDEGVVIQHGCTIRRILSNEHDCVGVLTSDDEVIEGDSILLAAGIWSDGFAREHGIRIPMQAAKGYHLMLDVESPPVIGCVCRESLVAVNPLSTGVRVAGTLELSGINHRMVQRRLDLLIKGAARCIHGIEDAPILDQWNGMRPCTSDGLPVIGPLPGLARTWIATGHGMMGITLAPVTALIIAQMIDQEATVMDTVPIAPDRFN